MTSAIEQSDVLMLMRHAWQNEIRLMKVKAGKPKAGKPKPQYFRLLYADIGSDGFASAFALLRGFVNSVASQPAHKTKLSFVDPADSTVLFRSCDPQQIDLSRP